MLPQADAAKMHGAGPLRAHGEWSVHGVTTKLLAACANGPTLPAADSDDGDRVRWQAPLEEVPLTGGPAGLGPPPPFLQSCHTQVKAEPILMPVHHDVEASRITHDPPGTWEDPFQPILGPGPVVAAPQTGPRWVPLVGPPRRRKKAGSRMGAKGGVLAEHHRKAQELAVERTITLLMAMNSFQRLGLWEAYPSMEFDNTRLRKYVRGGAEGTANGHLCRLEKYHEWATTANLAPWPAEADVVSQYIEHMAEDLHVGGTTPERFLSSLVWIHEIAGWTYIEGPRLRKVAKDYMNEFIQRTGPADLWEEKIFQWMEWVVEDPDGVYTPYERFLAGKMRIVLCLGFRWNDALHIVPRLMEILTDKKTGEVTCLRVNAWRTKTTRRMGICINRAFGESTGWLTTWINLFKEEPVLMGLMAEEVDHLSPTGHHDGTVDPFTVSTPENELSWFRWMLRRGDAEAKFEIDTTKWRRLHGLKGTWNTWCKLCALDHPTAEAQVILSERTMKCMMGWKDEKNQDMGDQYMREKGLAALAGQAFLFDCMDHGWRPQGMEARNEATTLAEYDPENPPMVDIRIKEEELDRQAANAKPGEEEASGDSSYVDEGTDTESEAERLTEADLVEVRKDAQHLVDSGAIKASAVLGLCQGLMHHGGGSTGPPGTPIGSKRKAATIPTKKDSRKPAPKKATPREDRGHAGNKVAKGMSLLTAGGGGISRASGSRLPPPRQIQMGGERDTPGTADIFQRDPANTAWAGCQTPLDLLRSVGAPPRGRRAKED